MKTAKKFLAVLMCMAMLFGSVAMLGGIASAAYEKQEGLLTFKVREDEAVLVGCAQNAMGEITVPAAVGGVPVKRIASAELLGGRFGAFGSCEGITKLNLPDSITQIDDAAFIYCSKLAEINIPAGVTEIGSNCFDGCESLKKIDIPDGVKSIGHNAFAGCKSLEEITIPEGVTSIDFYAFLDCVNLEKVKIPESIKEISYRAFYNCTNLKSINLPRGISDIGFEALDGTALYKDKLNWENGVLYVDSVLISAEKSIDGAYEIKQGTTLVASAAFNECYGLTSVTFPAGVTGLCEGAFLRCDGLSAVRLPDGLISIGDFAFSHCTGLMDVSISDSVTYLGYGAFEDSGIYNAFNFDGNVFYIDNALIRASENLSGEYAIKEGTTAIAEAAFANARELTDVVVPNSIKVIARRTFDECVSLRKVVLSDGLKEIGDRAFFNCCKLADLTIPSSVTEIGTVAFYSTALERVDLPQNLTVISHGLFENSSLKEINIPETVTYIGFEAFADSGLKSVYIPASVEKIEDSAFGDCNSLEKITVSPENRNYASDGSGALFTKDMRTLIMLPDGTKITEYTIPDGVYTVYPWAINGRVEVVNVPASVDECTDAFHGNWLTAVNVDPANKNYASDEYGVLYNKEMTELLCYPNGNPLDRYRVPDGVIVISDYSITDTALGIISLPASLMYSPHFDRYDSLALIYFRGNRDQWKNIKNEWGDGHSDNCAPVIIGRDIPEDEAKLNSDLALASLKTRFALIRANIKNIINKIIRFLKRIFDSIGIR
ncbi:MAG: leucine-rich repeat domain-containing protein [Clostridium sp.]|jgi:hypothetical protein|nr:leucine-rich repeat domain-containing protein [Clostridium sp.]